MTGNRSKAKLLVGCLVLAIAVLSGPLACGGNTPSECKKLTGIELKVCVQSFNPGAGGDTWPNLPSDSRNMDGVYNVVTDLMKAHSK